MQVSDTEEPVPLLKDKKPRPPMSEKQKANFAKAREVRAQNIKAKKEEKILEAQRALLQKEGKLPAPQPQVKEEPEEDEQEEIVSKVSPSKSAKSKPPAQVAQKTSAKSLLKEEKKMPKQNIKQKARVVEPSSEEESEDDSSSDEEIIVVKRKKKAKPAKSSRLMIHEDSHPSDDEYEGIAPKKPSSSFQDFFV
jgi:hypothetical protein